MGYARKDVEKTKKIAKKFVRYQYGAELYSIGLTAGNKQIIKKFARIGEASIIDSIGRYRFIELQFMPIIPSISSG